MLKSKWHPENRTEFLWQVIWRGGECLILQRVGKPNATGQGKLCTRAMSDSGKIPAQRMCLIQSCIHWLSSDPAVPAWESLAWEGVGYRSGETWQVACRWKGIKALLFAALWFTANSFMGKLKNMMSSPRSKIWVWKIMKYFSISAYSDFSL